MSGVKSKSLSKVFAFNQCNKSDALYYLLRLINMHQKEVERREGKMRGELFNFMLKLFQNLVWKKHELKREADSIWALLDFFMTAQLKNEEKLEVLRGIYDLLLQSQTLQKQGEKPYLISPLVIKKAIQLLNQFA